jgi:hypothetical protein
MQRRQALLSLLAIACGSRAPPVVPVPETPLALDPLENLAPAAGLEWALLLQPQKLTDVLPAIQIVVPEAHFALFAARHGGIDPRRADEILIAGYAKTTLTLGRIAIDPKAVEKSFTDRALHVEGRAADHWDVIRTWGDVGTTREQLVLFGRRGVGLELGSFGPLRASELFAEGRLKKASPMFRSPPLDLASAALGPAPARLFFPGPFSGDARAGFGGLLQVASAVGVSATPHGPSLAVRVAVLEAQGTDPKAAVQRLGATFDALAQSGLGRLCGLDRPKKGPITGTSETALFLDVELDSSTVAKGLHDATEASILEILKL